MKFILNKIMGSQNKKHLARLAPLVEAISKLEPEISKLSDEELARKTDKFRAHIKREMEKVGSGRLNHGDLAFQPAEIGRKQAGRYLDTHDGITAVESDDHGDLPRVAARRGPDAPRGAERRYQRCPPWPRSV